MQDLNQQERGDLDRRTATRNYAIFCTIATAVIAGLVGGVIMMFLQ